MQFQIPIDIKLLAEPISYGQKILLMGSCFTEHIGNALADLKFQVLQNPNGILFAPEAVCNSLLSYKNNKQYYESDLFQLNEVWHSWDHHSRLSGVDKADTLKTINQAQYQAHQYLKEAEWLIITLGSSFSYHLTKEADTASLELGSGVANCHRAPASWFTKQMLEIEDIKLMLETTLKELKAFNPNLKFIFTISPVRHIRDGVIDNNRSKARLIEAVHFICQKFEAASYFPAYELVIDVLRDYRFYDVDLVHPNYPATEFVLEKFTESCIDTSSRELMKEVRQLVIARKHRAFQPETKAHQKFLQTNFEKAKELKLKYPFLDLENEIEYFSRT
ncbi:MAG: GSCFA domain-containing protein [Bacteroidetes bacterium]|nr:GSCFA domain-containing protein [Bacteroidota bacterium]